MEKRNGFRLSLALALAGLALPGWGETHEQVFARHVLRADIVSSLAISESAAAEEHIKRAADRAILNVTLLSRDARPEQTLPAQVEALATDLNGITQKIALRESRYGNWVSYTGNFKVVPSEVLDFTVRARPEKNGELLEMQYRQQIWQDGRSR